jgi:hypothetical protein
MSYLFNLKIFSELHPKKVTDQVSSALIYVFLVYDKSKKYCF